MEDDFDLSEISKIANNDSSGHLLAEFLGKSRPIRKPIFKPSNRNTSIEVNLREGPIQNTESKNTAKEGDKNEQVENRAEEKGKNHETPPKKRPSSVNSQSNQPLRKETLKRLSQKFSLIGACNNASQSSAGFEFSPPISSTPISRIPNLGTPKKKPAPSSQGNIFLTPFSPNPKNNENRNAITQTSNSEKLGNNNNDVVAVNQNDQTHNTDIAEHQTILQPLTPSKKKESNKTINQAEFKEVTVARSEATFVPEINNPDEPNSVLIGGGTYTIQNEIDNTQKRTRTVNNDNILTDDDEPDCTVNSENRKTKSASRKLKPIETDHTNKDEECDQTNTDLPPRQRKLRKRIKKYTRRTKNETCVSQLHDEVKKQQESNLKGVETKIRISHPKAMDLRVKRSYPNHHESNQLEPSEDAHDVDEENCQQIDITTSIETENIQQNINNGVEIISDIQLKRVDNKQNEDTLANETSRNSRIFEGPEFEKEVFEDERSDDQIPFPGICKSYINSTKQMSMSKRRSSKSKRSLYSEIVGSEEHSSSTNSNAILSPPQQQQEQEQQPPQLQEDISRIDSNTANAGIVNVQNERTNDDHLVKKPQAIKRRKGRAKKELQQECPEEVPEIRRSKRARKEVGPSLFVIKLKESLLRTSKMSFERQRKKEESKRMNTQSGITPIASSTANPVIATSKKTKQKTALPITLETVHENEPETNFIEPANHFENQQFTSDLPTRNLDETLKTKNVRVNIKRLDSASCSRLMKKGQGTERNIPDIGSLLKAAPCISMGTHFERNFSQYSLVSCENIGFRNINDIEIVMSSRKMGYMRLQSRQIKKASRTLTNLSFTLLCGKVAVDVGEDRQILHLGDTIFIDSGGFYSIENLIEDASVMMFSKTSA